LKYQVEITETLQRTVTVDADDESSAVTVAKQLYRAEEIVLDSSNHIDTEFEILHTPSKLKYENWTDDDTAALADEVR